MTSINNIDLPTLLTDLHARYPGVLVQLRSARAGSAGLAQQLRDGALDNAAYASVAALFDESIWLLWRTAKEKR